MIFWTVLYTSWNVTQGINKTSVTLQSNNSLTRNFFLSLNLFTTGIILMIVCKSLLFNSFSFKLSQWRQNYYWHCKCHSFQDSRWKLYEFGQSPWTRGMCNESQITLTVGYKTCRWWRIPENAYICGTKIVL